jgi:shikimate kinase
LSVTVAIPPRSDTGADWLPGEIFTEEVAEVLKQRIPKYKSAAHYEIDTDELTPEQIADRIIDMEGKSRTVLSG